MWCARVSPSLPVAEVRMPAIAPYSGNWMMMPATPGTLRAAASMNAAVAT